MKDLPDKDNIEVGQRVMILNSDGDQVTGKFLRQFYDENGKVRTAIQVGPTKSYKDLEVGIYLCPASTS